MLRIEGCFVYAIEKVASCIEQMNVRGLFHVEVMNVGKIPTHTARARP
jgi:hypothetical protein